MYLITNRAVDNAKHGLNKFQSTSSQDGSLNLRIVKITGSKKSPTVEILNDKLSKTRAAQLKKQFNLEIDLDVQYYQSLELACWLFKEASIKKKHIALYVHGYNNDVASVVEATKELEVLYPDTIFVPFSWPAKGGGDISGTANYIDDKRDARASSGALDRVIQLIRRYHALLTEGSNRNLWAKAKAKHKENPEAARELYVALQEKQCKVTINLVCHSLGCYVLKHAAIPTLTSIRTLVFDNVCLLASDTNNSAHKEWVDVIETRGSIYIVINENDFALKWSRRKPGEEQKRRLGHYLKRLNSDYGTYIDVTSTKGVGEQHGYHNGRKVKTNVRLQRMFAKMFAGDRPERSTRDMQYLPDINAYRLK